MKKDVAVSSLFLSKFTEKFFTKFQIKKFAFTLAETLVVMGIIGIVAALTIPNLNQSTGDREKVAKLKKVYSNLEDAFGRATAVYGPLETWFVNDPVDFKSRNTRFANRITEFMKVSKNCGYEGAGCFANDARSLDGSEAISPLEWTDDPMVLLADGTALDFNVEQTDYVQIYVDIDGVKGSNTYGKDIFQIDIDENGAVLRERNFSNEKLKTDCFASGSFCTAWVIDVGNMDYLKADRNGKCPNGTQLSWENTSCK